MNYFKWFPMIVDGFVWICFVVLFVWSTGAIVYLPIKPNWINFLILVCYLAACLFVYRKAKTVWLGRAYVIVLIVSLFGLTLFIQPTNDRNWELDHAKVASVQIHNGLVRIENFRNFEYRSELDYEPSFEKFEFPLSAIDSVWFVIQRFTTSKGIAHVFLSFGLKPGYDRDYFSISVEIRREKGEAYDPIRGLYRSYEITHVIGDEADLIGVRTIHRPDDRVFMYRVNATAAQSQELFVQFANRISKLNSSPEFYHTLLNNCANGITSLTYGLTAEPINWLDPRMIFPGHSAEMAYELGLIGDSSTDTFQVLESNSRIDPLAKSDEASQDFSAAIRSRMIERN